MDNLRIEIRYAVLISLLTLLWLSFEFMIGLQDTYIQFHVITTWLALIIPVVCIRMSINERTEQQSGVITFKQAFATGFLVAFFAAVLAIPVQILFHKLINPDYFDTLILYKVNQASNLKQNVIDAREEAEKYINLTTSIMQAGLITLVFGTVVAAVSAWLMKTDKKPL